MGKAKKQYFFLCEKAWLRIILNLLTDYAPIAQLDRAFDYGSEG